MYSAETHRCPISLPLGSYHLKSVKSLGSSPSPLHVKTNAFLTGLLMVGPSGEMTSRGEDDTIGSRIADTMTRENSMK